MEKKRIEDYIRLYGIGTMAFFDRDYREIIGLSRKYVKLWKKKPNTDLGNSVEANYDEIKIILRPLASMTEEEGKELMTMLYKEILNIDPKLEDAEVIYGGDDCFGMKASEHEFEERIGLTVESHRGIEISINTGKMMTPQFQATKWLLSKGFDLFNLIPEGLALDATQQSLQDK